MQFVANAFNQTLMQPVARILERIVEYLPSLLGATTLVLLGLVVAWVLRAVVRRLLRYALGRLRTESTITDSVQQHRFYQWLPSIIGGVVFWIVLLFSVAAGVEALGLQAVSGLFSSITIYLPRVLVVVAIVFIGFVFAEHARTAVTLAAHQAGSASADTLGRGVKALIWLLAVLMSIDQLGINSSAVVSVLLIVGGSLLGASALAFGLGAKTTVSNIVAAHYVNKAYAVGNHVKIGELQGQVIEISRVAVVLDTAGGRVLVPAHRFNVEASALIEGGA